MWVWVWVWVVGVCGVMLLGFRILDGLCCHVSLRGSCVVCVVSCWLLDRGRLGVSCARRHPGVSAVWVSSFSFFLPVQVEYQNMCVLCQ